MSRFLVLIGCLFFLLSCNTEQTAGTTPTTAPTLDSNSVAYFAQACQNAAPAQLIPMNLVERYVQPALEQDSLHPFHPNAAYHYGEVLYQDSQLVVLTFYYKLTIPKKDLAASFLASYKVNTNQFLDSKMVFGSSVFDYKDSLGYRLGYSCKSTIEYPELNTQILTLQQHKKYLYSQFTNEKIIEDKNTRVFWVLNQKGKFIASVN